jgi:mannose-1-phosphate guanylyltransferase
MQQGQFEWADLGTWASIHDDVPSDADGNVLLNTKAYLYESKNNIIRLSEGRTAVVKGLDDYVIAEEGEILMICPRADVAAMRKMHTDIKFS